MTKLYINQQIIPAKLISLLISINRLFKIKVLIANNITIENNRPVSVVLDNEQTIYGIVHKKIWQRSHDNLNLLHITPRLQLLAAQTITASQEITQQNHKQISFSLLQDCGYKTQHIQWKIAPSIISKRLIIFAGESSLNALLQILNHFAYNFSFKFSNQTEYIIIFDKCARVPAAEPSISWHSCTQTYARIQHRALLPSTPDINLTGDRYKNLIRSAILYRNNHYWLNYYDKPSKIKFTACEARPNIAYIAEKIDHGYRIYFTDPQNLLHAAVCSQLYNKHQEISYQLLAGSKVLIDYLDGLPIIIKCIYSGTINDNFNLTCNNNNIIDPTTADALRNRTGKTIQSYRHKGSTLRQTSNFAQLEADKISYDAKSQIIYSSTSYIKTDEMQLASEDAKLEAKTITFTADQTYTIYSNSHLEADSIKHVSKSIDIISKNIGISGEINCDAQHCNVTADYMRIQAGECGIELNKSGVVNFFGADLSGSVALNGYINKSNMAPSWLTSAPLTKIDKKPTYPLNKDIISRITQEQNKDYKVQIYFPQPKQSEYSQAKLTDNLLQQHSAVTDTTSVSWHNISAGPATIEIEQQNTTQYLYTAKQKPLHVANINIEHRTQTFRFNILPPPIIINLRQSNNALLDAQQINQLNDKVCIFIHGFNVSAGEFGKEFNSVKLQNKIVTPQLTGFDCSILRDIKNIAAEYKFNHTHKLDPNINPNKNLNGSGAYNWLIHIEHNLNQANGFNEYNFDKYKRIILISWPSKPDNITDYHSIVNKCGETAHALEKLIMQLKQHDKDINIIAHSLGCAVCCKLLDRIGKRCIKSPIKNVVLLNSAVPASIFDSSKHDKNSLWYMPNILFAANKIIILHSVNDNILGPISHTQKIRKDDTEEYIIANTIDILHAYSLYGLSSWLNCDIKDIFNYDKQNHIYKMWRRQFNPNLPQTIDEFIKKNNSLKHEQEVMQRAKLFISNARSDLFSPGLHIQTASGANRSFASIERAYYLLKALKQSAKFNPEPALGYSGIQSTDKIAQHALSSKKLQSWNCDDVISSHSALKTPNSKQKQLYKKIVSAIYF